MVDRPLQKALEYGVQSIGEEFMPVDSKSAMSSRSSSGGGAESFSNRWAPSDMSDDQKSSCSVPAALSESNAELVVPRVTLQTEHPSPAQDIGFLRIIVCGDSGIGKSTLIERLTTAPGITPCGTENPEQSSVFVSDWNNDDDNDKFTERSDDIAHAIQEVFASTMRESNQSYIKNLCFVDTPGYGACLDAEAVISTVVNYVERQFLRTYSILNPTYPNTPELVRLVHNPNGAHTHIDACLYIILNRLKRVDIEYMRALVPLCNVIPILIQRDRLTAEQEKELRLDILKELEENDIHYFKSVVAVSNFCSDSRDHLKSFLFDRHLESLRVSTARKFVAWRASQPVAPITTMTMPDELLTMSASTLTTAETVDRIHAIRTRELHTVNLWISRYVSEKRKSMERAMVERERELKNELQSVERRKRAELLIAEFSKLFQEGNLDNDLKKVDTSPLTSSLRKSEQQQKGSDQLNGLLSVVLTCIVIFLQLCIFLLLLGQL